MRINLYTTATRKHVGSSRWLRPPTRNFALEIPTFRYLKKLKFALPPTQMLKILICVTPNTKPQRESVEYKLRWVPDANILRWACRFYVVYFLFPCVGYPVCSGYGLQFIGVVLRKNHITVSLLRVRRPITVHRRRTQARAPRRHRPGLTNIRAPLREGHGKHRLFTHIPCMPSQNDLDVCVNYSGKWLHVHHSFFFKFQ